MQCHYCSASAVYAAESDGISVGLCEEHLEEQLEAFAESSALTDLRDTVDLHRQ